MLLISIVFFMSIAGLNVFADREAFKTTWSTNANITILIDNSTQLVRWGCYTLEEIAQGTVPWGRNYIG